MLLQRVFCSTGEGRKGQRWEAVADCRANATTLATHLGTSPLSDVAEQASTNLYGTTVSDICACSMSLPLSFSSLYPCCVSFPLTHPLLSLPRDSPTYPLVFLESITHPKVAYLRGLDGGIAVLQQPREHERIESGQLLSGWR